MSAQGTGPTIDAWAQAWMSEVEARGKHGLNTLDTYRVMLNRVRRQWGRIPLAALRREDVLKGLRQQGRQVAPMTLRLVRSRLAALLDEARKRGMVERNVAADVKLPKVEARGGRRLTPDEYRVLLSKAKTHRMGTLVRFVMATKLRRGEVCGLCWGDFDPARGTVRVRRVVAQRGNSRTTWTKAPKAGVNARIVTLSPDMLAETTHRMQAWREVYAKTGAAMESMPMFTNNLGDAWRPSALTQAMSDFLRDIGLEGITLKDLAK